MLILILVVSAGVKVTSGTVHLKYVLRLLDCNITDNLVQADIHGIVYHFVFNYLFMHTGIMQLFVKSFIRKDDPDVQTHCRTLLYVKGPLITKITVDFNKLRKLYSWEQDEIDIIKDHINYAKILMSEINATHRSRFTVQKWKFCRDGKETVKELPF